MALSHHTRVDIESGNRPKCRAILELLRVVREGAYNSPEVVQLRPVAGGEWSTAGGGILSSKDLGQLVNKLMQNQQVFIPDSLVNLAILGYLKVLPLPGSAMASKHLAHLITSSGRPKTYYVIQPAGIENSVSYPYNDSEARRILADYFKESLHTETFK